WKNPIERYIELYIIFLKNKLDFSMNITTVCSFCRYHDTEPNIEINFKDGKIYYICRECKKENIISLISLSSPFPKVKRL
ncbi:MAG: hypothetical protein WC942_11075, partial [Clostridia bacterium]